MIVETHPRHAYFRRSPCGRRLLFGGRASARPIPLPLAARRLREMIDKLFGDKASSLEYSHCWSGLVAFTGSLMPHIAERRGVFYVGGYCGSGVALSNYLGAKAALRIVGDPAGETAFAEVKPTIPALFRLPDAWGRTAAETALQCRETVLSIRGT